MFGGTDQTSCSSSDGSCSNHITQQGRELDHCEQMCVPNYYCDGVQENQKMTMISQGHDYVVNGVASNGGTGDQKQNGNGTLWGGGIAPLEYGLEEIKQLISSTSTFSSSSCSNFVFDENKTGESVMYY